MKNLQLNFISEIYEHYFISYSKSIIEAKIKINNVIHRIKLHNVATEVILH